MSEEFNNIDLQKVAGLLVDEIEVLEKINRKSALQPADTRRIALASDHIGVATKIVLKRVARIEKFLNIPKSFD